MEVLSLFIKEEPQLVLMDIGLPLFNGYRWCQEIRKVSKVPIMFLSSRDQAHGYRINELVVNFAINGEFSWKSVLFILAYTVVATGLALFIKSQRESDRG